MLEELLTDETYGQELVLLNLLCEHLITVRPVPSARLIAKLDDPHAHTRGRVRVSAHVCGGSACS